MLSLHASYAATLIVDSKILSQLVNSQFVYTVIARHGKGFFADANGAPSFMASSPPICLSSSDQPNKYPVLPASNFVICPNCGLDLGSGFL